MSPRAPSTNDASPTKTFPLKTAPGGSLGCASRWIWTRTTSISSIAQPVTATDPLLALPSAGVSNEPTGPVVVPGALSVRMTLVVLGVLDVPAAVTVMVPVAVARPASEASLATVTVKLPLPVPLPPVIFSHGELDGTAAVQAIPVAPVIVTATGCPLVMFDSVPAE